VRTVVVGAGAAGAVIAARLTERRSDPVLLLEAGPDYGADIPADLADGTRNSLTAHDWGLTHRPTPSLPPFPMPRGRVVGGSSAVNTCIALRGQPEDYDEWADRGLEGWAWADCLPAFKQLERDLDLGDLPYHGSDGPLPVRRHPPGELVPWQAAFLDACERSGLPACADTNEPGATGYGCHAMNKIDGRRISAAEAWLTPEVRLREHLTIASDTVVHRLRIRGDRVTGVEVEQHGEVRAIDADRVVLCGGTFGTLGVLLRSGIGPQSELDRMGVDCVRDVPAVGARLLDHPGCALFFRPKSAADFSPLHPLIQTVALMRAEGVHRNTLQLQAGSCVPTKWGAIRGVSLMMSVCKPYSAGRVRFRTADPGEKPVIQSNFYRDPRDLALAVEGLGILSELADTPSMQQLGRGFYPTQFVARREWLLRRWIPVACDSGYHPCGTVPMGEATDHRGRIDGLEALTIADASLFPTIPASNIHLPTLMLGERFGAWLADC